jgi:hypothetical protein
MVKILPAIRLLTAVMIGPRVRRSAERVCLWRIHSTLRDRNKKASCFSRKPARGDGAGVLIYGARDWLITGKTTVRLRSQRRN